MKFIYNSVANELINKAMRVEHGFEKNTRLIKMSSYELEALRAYSILNNSDFNYSRSMRLFKKRYKPTLFERSTFWGGGHHDYN